jgi:FkbM family methyltransferase
MQHPHPGSAGARRLNSSEPIGGPARKLRPAKMRNAVKRRLFERRMHRTRLEETAGVLQLGSPYGGWTMPEGVIESRWVCYSVGAGGDITFDVELIGMYGVRVRSIDAVAEYVESAREQASGDERFSAHQAAIGIVNGPVRLQCTHDEASRSVSPAGLYESERYIELPGRTLPSLMSELGDERIDLLKLDIEGGEYELLASLDLRALGTKVLAVQLHHTASVRHARKLIADLGRAGYEPVAMRPAVKITFLDRSLRKGLVWGGPARATSYHREE